MGGLCSEGHEFLRLCRSRDQAEADHMVDVLVTQHSRWTARRIHSTGESFVGRGHRVEREQSEQATARGREARGAVPAVRGRNAGQGTSAGGQHRAGTARSGVAEAGAAGRSRGGSQAAARGRDARGAIPASRGRDAGQVTRAGGQLRAGTTRSRPAEARNAAGSRGRGRSGGA